MPDTDINTNDAKRYIRTFDGDATAVKRGAHPDLVPFGESGGDSPFVKTAQPTPSSPEKFDLQKKPEKLETKISQQEINIDLPSPKEAIGELKTYRRDLRETAREERLQTPRNLLAQDTVEESRDEVLERLRARVASHSGQEKSGGIKTPESIESTPPQKLGAPPAERLVGDENSSQDTSPIHTYTSDFSDHVKKTKASPATILAAEQDAAPFRPNTVGTETKTFHFTGKNLAFLLGGLVLLGGAGGSTYFIYSFLEDNPQTVLPKVVATTPIFVDEREKVSGSGSTLLQHIQSSVIKPLSANNVRLLLLDGTLDVFYSLAFPAPQILLRNIDSNGSIAGIINTGDSSSPFFILRVSSYRETFAGMLEWEPRMEKDLNDLYPTPKIVIENAPEEASTSVAIATKQLSFQDEVIHNKDVRILRDVQGNSVLLYGYWDPLTLIIARDKSAFTELSRRLGASQSGPK